MQPEIPFFISTLFILLVVVLIALLLAGVNAAWKRNSLAISLRRKKLLISFAIISAWLVFLKVISQLNVLNDFSAMPPRMIIVFLPPLIATVIMARSKSISSLLTIIPNHWLIFIQSFRMVMEVILYLLFIHQIIPQQMTFAGRNFDVLTGISAVVIGYLVYSKRISSPKIIIAWNIIGLLLLANIIGIAILSAPFPFRAFMNEPSNTIIAYFPFVWLPGFVVPVAYSMHVFSIKQNLHERSL